MQFSAASFFFLALRLKYFPRHSVLGHYRPVSFIYCQRQSFTLMLNIGKNYSYIYFSRYVFS
jgi:hypothetical protein